MTSKKTDRIPTINWLMGALVIAMGALIVYHEHSVVKRRYEHRQLIAEELLNIDAGCEADSLDVESIIKDQRLGDYATMRAVDFGIRGSACRESIKRVIAQIDSLDQRL